MTTFAERNAYYRSYARSRGVDPDFITGLTLREGGLSGTFGGHYDPTRSGAGGTSYGPFQLRLPGLGTDFAARYGQPNASNWQEQGRFAIDYIAKNGSGPWGAVRDNGGISGLTSIGRAWQAANGGGGSSDVASAEGDTATPPSRPSDAELSQPGSSEGGTSGGGPLSSGMIGGALGQLSGMIPGPLGQITGQLGGIVGQVLGITAAQANVPGTNTGAPLDVTNAPDIGAKAADTLAKTLAKSSEGVSKTIGQSTGGVITGLAADTNAITATGTGITQYFGNLVYNILPRFLLGTAAVLLIGLAFWMMSTRKAA